MNFRTSKAIWEKARPFGFFVAFRCLFSKKQRKKIRNRINNERARKLYGSNWYAKRKTIIQQLIFRHGAQCRICGKKWNPRSMFNNRKRKNKSIVTIDHIKKLSDGGENELENLQLLCMECHVAKTRMENKTSKGDTIGGIIKRQLEEKGVKLK